MQIGEKRLGGSGPLNWGFLISNGNGDAALEPLKYAVTIAHEFGHVLGFKHREPAAGWPGDGLSGPHDKNVMDIFTADNAKRDDFDLIQAEAVQFANIFK
jgi:hypothetical protein